MELVLGVVGLIFGAVFGSFACCMARRLRREELGQEKLGRRSVCVSCGVKLAWYENLPIISWVGLRGKCRRCGARIGWTEILAEVGLGLVMAGIFWKYGRNITGVVDGAILALLVLGLVGMWVLVIYDAKWQKMPVSILTFLIICAIIYVLGGGVWSWLGEGVSLEKVLRKLLDTLGGVGVLAGTYYVLYKVSKEKWVGGGDYLLATSIALFLRSWWLAVMVLAVANFLATAVILMRGRQKKIAFGPFLVLGFFLVLMFGEMMNSLIGF